MNKQVGDMVNLENDILGKYVAETHETTAMKQSCRKSCYADTDFRQKG